jgi:hypothetical protein
MSRRSERRTLVSHVSHRPGESGCGMRGGYVQAGPKGKWDSGLQRASLAPAMRWQTRCGILAVATSYT